MAHTSSQGDSKAKVTNPDTFILQAKITSLEKERKELKVHHKRLESRLDCL